MSSDHFNTPPELLSVIRKFAPIALDPCSNAHSQVGAQLECRKGCEEFEDGLAISWAIRAGGGLVFMNPPYSRGSLLVWTAKAAAEARGGAAVVALVPAYTAERWWGNITCGNAGENCWSASAVCFIRGRVRFWENGAPAPSAARFSSALVWWDPHYSTPEARRFHDIFNKIGWCVDV